jgi:hypothetical protein
MGQKETENDVRCHGSFPRKRPWPTKTGDVRSRIEWWKQRLLE